MFFSTKAMSEREYCRISCTAGTADDMQDAYEQAELFYKSTDTVKVDKESSLLGECSIKGD